MVNALYIYNMSIGNGATQYKAQLVFSDKCCAIKGLVVCNSWDLEPLDLLKRSGPKLLSTVPCGIDNVHKLFRSQIPFNI